MTHTLQELDSSKSLVLTAEMLTHVGVANEVRVVLEDGKIILTAPTSVHNRKTFEDAMATTFERYSNTLRDLAKAD